MKYLRSFLLFLSAAFIISSCQKELSFEEGTARGSLKRDATGECLPATVVGSYKRDTLLNASNYVDIQVDISQTGTYAIKTDTLNGYSFSATGVVAVEGLNTVRLLASGRPVAASLDVFTVKFDTTSCEINIVVTGAGGGGGGTAAVYTLVGSPTACTGATQNGNYNVGLPTSASNTITINANVTTAGTYNINTGALINGVSFSGAGTLAQGNGQIITLTANGGTPAVADTFSYPLNNGTSNCSFDVIYGAAVSPANYTFNCATANVQGTYQANTAMTPANRITIDINVTTAGSYNITSTANGVTFSGSGILPATPTVQTITLNATGTAGATVGPVNFILTGGGGPNCSVPVTFTAAPTTNGTLSFQIGTVTKTFNFVNGADTSVQAAPPPLPPGNFFLLSIAGDATSSQTQETFFLDVAKQAPYFSNGSTYTVNDFAQFILLDVGYTDNTGVDYTATTDGTTQTPPFSVTITTITPTNVKGTFTGPLKNAAGATITVTNGAFDLPLQ